MKLIRKQIITGVIVLIVIIALYFLGKKLKARKAAAIAAATKNGNVAASPNQVGTESGFTQLKPGYVMCCDYLDEKGNCISQTMVKRELCKGPIVSGETKYTGDIVGGGIPRNLQ
jgi:hypothetical protein